MPTIKCRICSTPFYAKPNWIKRGWGKYCSRACQHRSQKNGSLVRCFICVKVVYKPHAELQKSKSKKYFCSKSCQTVWRNSMVYVGPNHPNWKSGNSAYRNILLRSKAPRMCKRCKTTDIRTLATHHIDFNRKNNHNTNLIWLCHNCHFLVHRYDGERTKLMEALV